MDHILFLAVGGLVAAFALSPDPQVKPSPVVPKRAVAQIVQPEAAPGPFSLYEPGHEPTVSPAGYRPDGGSSGGSGFGSGGNDAMGYPAFDPAESAAGAAQAASDAAAIDQSARNAAASAAAAMADEAVVTIERASGR
jgi:hypothetical protein